MLLDVGEGVTDCAVIRSAQIVVSHAVGIGCADLREGIREHVLQQHQLAISEDEAERVLRAISVRDDVSGEVVVSGSHHRQPCELPLCAAELKTALAPALGLILGCPEMLLRDLPPALSVEVIEDGIFLSGGGALLQGMRERVAHVARVDVHIVPDPLRAVVFGAHEMLPAAATLRLWRD